jgi:hypothetical protein
MSKKDQIINEGPAMQGAPKKVQPETQGGHQKKETQPQGPAPKKRKRGRNFFIILALFILASGWIYAFWNQFAMNRKHEKQLSVISQEAMVFGDETQEELLLFSLKSAGLGVRSEWIRNNQEQVDLYLGNLAQHPRVLLAQVIDEQGNVLISSDKHLQGTRFKATGLEENPLVRKEASFYAVSPEEAWVFAPIMGIDTRLGTLMIRYHTRTFSPVEEGDEPEIRYEPAPPESEAPAAKPKTQVSPKKEPVENPVLVPDSNNPAEAPIQKPDTLS